MSQDRLELAAASIKQRNALLKTEEVFENAIETSLEQDQVVLKYLEKINEELRKLELRLEDQCSDCDGWTEAHKAARDRMDLLHNEQDQIEYDRLNRERERAVWRHAVLEQYRNAMLTQTEADKPLQDHLRDQGLMNFDMDHFFDMWMKLPAQYRQSRHLQKRFEDYKVAVEIYRGQHKYTDEQIWEAFFDHDEGQFDAFCAYEDAKIELDLATRRNERLNQDLMTMEEGYRTARLLGRDMPTPSEFARDCISERGSHVRALVNAKARFAMATDEVHKFDEISELNSDAMVNSDQLSTTYSSASSESSLEDLNSAGRRYPFVAVDQLEILRQWRQDVVPDEDPSVLLSSSIDLEARINGSESLAMDDSKTVYERRTYQKIRSSQWHNRLRHRDRQLNMHSRTQATKPASVDKKSQKNLRSRRLQRGRVEARRAEAQIRTIVQRTSPSEGAGSN